MAISLKEIIKDTELASLPKDIQDNLAELLIRVNEIRTAYGKPMTVTSGLRTKEDHLRIYRDIAKKKGVKFDEKKVPMGSQHLRGAAVDIADPKGELAQWLKNNPEPLKEADLFCEDTDYTKGWVHFQIFSPASGKRFFKP